MPAFSRIRRLATDHIFTSAFGRIGRCYRKSHIHVGLRPHPTPVIANNIFMSAFGRIGGFRDKSHIYVGLRPHRTLVGANNIFMSAFGRKGRSSAQIIYSCRPSAASDASYSQIIHSCRPSAASDASYSQIVHSCRPSAASGAWPQIIYSCRPSADGLRPHRTPVTRKSYIHVGLLSHLVPGLLDPCCAIRQMNQQTC